MADLTPIKFPQTLVAGDGWPPLCWQVNDETGTPYSLVGAVIKQQVKTKDGAVVKTINTSDFILSNSNTLATYSSSLAVDIPPGAYDSDIQIVFAGKTLPVTPFDCPIIVRPDKTT